MRLIRKAEVIVAPTRSAPDAEREGAGFDAVFAWAMRQEFEEDHAERARREAWGGAAARRMATGGPS